MRSWFTLIALCLGLAACATPVKKPFFWSVEKDGKTSYVLGTLHQGVPIGALPDSVMDKLNAAKLLVVEVTAESQLHYQAQLLFYLYGEDSLDHRLSPRAWKFVQQRLQPRFGAKLKRLTPVAALMAVSQDYPIEMDKRTAWENAPQNGMDANLKKRAKKKGIPISELDQEPWIEVAIQCLFGISANIIDQMAIGRHPPLTALDLEMSADDYRSGETERLMHIIAALSDDDRACLLGLRNDHWVERLDPWLSANAGTFVAVGAAHLVVEPESLLSLLRKRGYKVERLP